MKQKRLYPYIILCILMLVSCMLIPSSSDAAAKRVRVNVKNLSLTKGQTFTLRLYNSKKNHRITYTSGNTNLVTVNAKKAKSKKATVTAIDSGTTTIQITVRTSKKVVTQITCNVTISPSPISIKFARKKVLLSTNSFMNLRVIIKPNTSLANAMFESDDTDVVTVNSRGRIYAVHPGTAKIIATLPSGQQAICKVTVSDQKPSGEHKPKKPSLWVLDKSKTLPDTASTEKE